MGIESYHSPPGLQLECRTLPRLQWESGSLLDSSGNTRGRVKYSHHLQFGLYTPVFGLKQRCWVVHASVGFKTLVLVIHAGTWLKILVLGHIAYTFWQSFLGCFVFMVAVNNGIALLSLFCAFH